MDECTHEGHRCLLAPRWYPCEPRVRSSCRLFRKASKAYRALFFATWTVMWSRWRPVSESSAMKGAKYCVLRHPPEDRQDDVLHHFRWREGVEAPVVHRRQAQPVLALQGELLVRLQLESQVGDGVRRWYPVPWVSRWGQRRSCRPGTPSVVAMAHLRELSSMFIIPRYAATASTPSTKCCSVWATTSGSSM